MKIFRLAAIIVFASVAQFAVAAPTSAALPAGTLVRGSLPGVYHIGDDGKRYVFPNEKTYFSWYADFYSVIFISDSELASIPLGGNVTYHPGKKMLKIPSDPKVYAVAEGGVLREVADEQTASALYGQDWKDKIDDLPESFFTNYTIGTPITSTADYDPLHTELSAMKIDTNGKVTAPSEDNATSGASPSFQAVANECNPPGTPTSATDNFNIRLQVINSVTKEAVPNATLAYKNTNLTIKTDAYGVRCVARLSGILYATQTGTYEVSDYVNPADYTTPGTVLIPVKPRSDGSAEEPVPGDEVTITVINSVTGRPVVGIGFVIKNTAGVGQNLTTDDDGTIVLPRAYGIVYTAPTPAGYESSGEINLNEHYVNEKITVNLKPSALTHGGTELVFPPILSHSPSSDGGTRITGTVTKNGVPSANITVYGAGMGNSVKTDAQGKFTLDPGFPESVRFYTSELVTKQFQVDPIRGETVTVDLEI